jgi:hypothetical protein
VAWGVDEGEDNCIDLHDLYFVQSDAQHMAKLKGPHAKAIPLYAAPSHREWVGLTDEEIAEIGKMWLKGNRMLPFPLANAIEAKLKEKNA